SRSVSIVSVKEQRLLVRALRRHPRLPRLARLRHTGLKHPARSGGLRSASGRSLSTSGSPSPTASLSRCSRRLRHTSEELSNLLGLLEQSLGLGVLENREHLGRGVTVDNDPRSVKSRAALKRSGHLSVVLVIGHAGLLSGSGGVGLSRGRLGKRVFH